MGNLTEAKGADRIKEAWEIAVRLPLTRRL